MFSKTIKIFLSGTLVLGLLSISSVASAQQYKQISRLGTSEAVCPAGVQTLQQLQQFFSDNSAAVKSILTSSGWSGNADALFAAVANGDVTEGAYPVGTKMAWMGANVKGQYLAKNFRQWAGTKSFSAFRVNVSSGCQIYEIAIPKQCCNISLVSISPDNSSECTAPNAAAGLGADTDAPAQVDDRSKSAAGAVVPFIGLFAASEKRPRFETAWAMDMIDTAQLKGLRAGVLKNISDKTSIFGQISAYDRSGVSEGNVYPGENIALDVGFERKLTEHLFFGGGIGIWNIDDAEYNDGSLFGHFGGNVGKSNLQWYVEGRLFDSDSLNHDSLSDNKMLSAGVRYLVK